MRLRTLLVALASMVALSGSASASPIIFLGFDTNGPVQQYSTAGAFLGNFGQGGATGSALDGAGHVFTVAPSFGANHIVRYDSLGNPLNSFTAAVGGQWIEDMAMGAGNTIWAGTFEGNIVNIDATTGATNSSFSVPGGAFEGVAYDGTNLWVTGGAFTGANSSKIYKYTTGGTLLSTINTAFADIGGLGYDRATNTLWAGYFGDVRQFDLSGNVLSHFITGTNFHDGLEIGEVSRLSTVPEPASVVLLGGGLLAVVAARRRHRS